jgi:hypothetical protein
MGKKHDELRKKIDFFAEIMTLVAIAFIAAYLLKLIIKSI